MRIVSSNTVVHREGAVHSKERGAVIRRNNVVFEHVKEPVIVARPKIEDFSSLVVVHDKMEYYS